MSNERTGIIGAIEVELKIHIINPDTGAQGVVTYNCPVGAAPNEDKLRQAMGEAARSVEAQGFKLMGPNTFFNNVLIPRKFGQRGNFALPKEFYFPTSEQHAEAEHEEVESEDDED